MTSQQHWAIGDILDLILHCVLLDTTATTIMLFSQWILSTEHQRHLSATHTLNLLFITYSFTRVVRKASTWGACIHIMQAVVEADEM